MVDELASRQRKTTVAPAVRGLILTITVQMILKPLAKKALLALRVVDAFDRRFDTLVVCMKEEMPLRQLLAAKLTVE